MLMLNMSNKLGSLFIPVEYKEIWQVQNVKNSNNELKARFHKTKKEKEVSNEVVKNFLKEASILKQFNHPNVIFMYGISLHNNKPCVVMQLMTNGNLKNYLKKNSKVGFLFVVSYFVIFIYLLSFVLFVFK